MFNSYAAHHGLGSSRFGYQVVYRQWYAQTAEKKRMDMAEMLRLLRKRRDEEGLNFEVRVDDH
eukprot:2547493-Prymnesium_polylepis.1